MIDTPLLRDSYRRLQKVGADFGLNPESFNSLCRDYLRAQDLPETPKNWVRAAGEVLQDLYLEDQCMGSHEQAPEEEV